MPGIMDRIYGGLLGPTTNYGGILDPKAEEMAKREAQMAFAAQLMQAGGYSQTPVTMGQALGTAMQSGQKTQQESLNRALEANLVQSQMTRNSRVNQPTSVEEYEYFKNLPPEEQEAYRAMRKQSGPAAIQEYEYFKSLSPEDQQNYTKLQRQPTVPKVVMIGNVPHLVDPVTGTRQPLSTLEQEAAGAGAVEQAKGYGSAFGKSAGEIAGNIQKKGSDAKIAQSTLEGADALIDIATGSAAGNVRDKFAAAFGYATEPAQALAELKVLQANLMLNQPRMEGPQSDRDVILYREAAGQIGDPNVPADIKKAALRQIIRLQNKYSERADAATPANPAAAKPATPGTETAAQRAKRMGL